MLASETFTRVLGLHLFHRRQVRLCFLPECSSLACAAKHGGHVMSELARHVSWNVRAWSCCEPADRRLNHFLRCSSGSSREAGGAAAHGSDIISDLCAGEELKLNRSEVFT